MYETSFREYRELPALTDYFKNETFSYYEVAKEIAKLHMLFSKAGLKKGERIALVGRNNPRWVITYIAALTYGAVIVPLLQDFNDNDINHIISHSEARLVFAGDIHWDMIDEGQLKNVKAVFSLTDFQCVYEKFGTEITNYRENLLSHYRSKYPKGFTINDIAYDEIADDSVAVISYTSGTTGFSKGVMLTVDNITANVAFALEKKFHYQGSRVLSLLPLAHIYGCVFDMLTPLSAGSHIVLLGNTPSVKISLKAMHEVKPHLMCMVPAMMEKIVRRQLLPLAENRLMKLFTKIPVADNVIRTGIRKKLLSSFGGEIMEVNIGGAPLNREVAEFLVQIKFPFTVGYGMTECAPLISYSPHEEYKPGSCGRVIPGIEVHIESDDPQNIQGEITVKGPNVMKGYFKDPALTSKTIKDGWLHTGDIGTMDPDGTLYIRGRRESAITLPEGQLIYPEELESRLNVMDCVMESLVLERHGRLVALVVPDYEQADAQGITVSALRDVMKENLKTLNSLIAPFEAVSDIILYPEEFEKTPKKSIKRFIYTN